MVNFFLVQHLNLCRMLFIIELRNPRSLKQVFTGCLFLMQILCARTRRVFANYVCWSWKCQWLCLFVLVDLYVLPHDAMRARYSSSLFAYTSYAENVAQPLFRTPLQQKSIGISCPPRTHRRLQSCSNGFAAASHAGTERRADIVPFHRPCTAHSAGSARNFTRMNNFLPRLPSCVRHTRTML